VCQRLLVRMWVLAKSSNVINLSMGHAGIKLIIFCVPQLIVSDSIYTVISNHACGAILNCSIAGVIALLASLFFLNLLHDDALTSTLA